jgi:hypothetical protein
MSVNSAAIHAGRLLEVRADAGYRTVSDVDALFDTIDEELAKVPPSLRVVIVADWRACPVMNPRTSERLLERIKAMNPRIERSVALATPGSPTAVMQFMRVIREANLPHRKVFLNAGEAIQFLDEVLSPSEARRLRAFLDRSGER